jgi:hypothetical protein
MGPPRYGERLLAMSSRIRDADKDGLLERFLQLGQYRGLEFVKARN